MHGGAGGTGRGVESRFPVVEGGVLAGRRCWWDVVLEVGCTGICWKGAGVGVNGEKASVIGENGGASGVWNALGGEGCSWNVGVWRLSDGWLSIGGNFL